MSTDKRLDTDERPEDLVDHPDDIQEHASAVLISKDVADVLDKTYPGWLWAVSIDPRGGVFNIRSLRLSGEWGYILKLDWIQHDPKVRRRLVLAAAAEVLERFGMRVGPYDYAMWAAGPRDLAGNPRPILTDKSKRVQRFARDQALTNAVREGKVVVRHEDSQRADGSTHRRILLVGKPNG